MVGPLRLVVEEVQALSVQAQLLRHAVVVNIRMTIVVKGGKLVDLFLVQAGSSRFTSLFK
jgi:hypothetical protein